MKRKTGANLFTIEFSSSSDYDSYKEEEEEEKKPPPPPPVKKHRQITPTRVTKRQVTLTPAVAGLIELSESSSNSESTSNFDDVDFNPTRTTASPHQPTSKDIFTIGDSESSSLINQSAENSPKKSDVDPNHKNTKNKHESSPKQNFKHEAISNEDINPENEKTKNDKNVNGLNEGQINLTNKPKIDYSVIQKPKALPIPIRTDTWPTYLITRESKMHLNGKRIFFSFFDGNKQIYAAKCKSKNAESVFIMKGKQVHLGETADAIILVGNEGSDFSLRKSSNSGDEIITVRIVPPKTPADTARKMAVTFFMPKDGTPARITSKNPGLNPDGKVEHDFEGHFAVSSMKNAVLVAKANGPNLVLIRKTGPDAIEIDVRFEHEDLWIFAIGIASFLSRVK
ncbi:hypothetical protein TRFO_11083 [Tritrichomonas foetus]|uniref:Tubby C-terminal domain-containing protein n=1 Tax=Tritrichomonas foetus TaxID=1144522 RepID=A0A1J4J5D4_9EUKA|nr:hypothetical protein TRFO_11083 [Tritrichomonas foetus]|eukprot:OHS94470.1 hypothetical protein TRFO_11083 [Tritrichomonas foetus]